jgi:D-cysteine desulfhydrase
MDLSRFPRRRYTHAPTPIEFLPHFTKALAKTCPGGAGPDIWIKRDDMLGLFPGGNKTRKLEFLAADALAQGADTLITCGAPQSNHCRITLAAAIKEGLKARFVIEERVPNSYRKEAGGNNFMFELMGVEAITVVPGGSDMAATMSRIAQELASLGRKGYIIRAAARTRSAAWVTSPACRRCSSSGSTWAWRSMPSWSARAARVPMAAWLQAFTATTSRSR